MRGISLVEAGYVPDAIIRLGIRRLLRRRLAELPTNDCEAAEAAEWKFHDECSQSPIALLPDLANAQHYEVSPAFFETVLGPRLKYSCALWPEGTTDLGTAEENMLALSCERAGLEDGMRVLDLGCGWGSLSLWIAEHYPKAQIVSVSNSKPQRESILGRCARRGIHNIEVITADVNDFEPTQSFDRVMSVEMFEHVRNHELLLSRISRWLEPDGKIFVHHFSHRHHSYLYETEGEDDWMGRHFFSGGMMPADDRLLRCQQDLAVERKWRVDGTHYQKTSEAWLELQDANAEKLRPILAEVYGNDGAAMWNQRWRLFFLACSELFGYRNGNEWWVTHTLLSQTRAAQ
jgi:cyclopropane-fatty-acyl-phospholipid synthase